MGVTIILKTLSKKFNAIKNRWLKSDIVPDTHEVQKGDVIRYEECKIGKDGKMQKTGKCIECEVTYVLFGERNGVLKGYEMISIENCRDTS